MVGTNVIKNCGHCVWFFPEQHNNGSFLGKCVVAPDSPRRPAAARQIEQNPEDPTQWRLVRLPVTEFEGEDCSAFEQNDGRFEHNQIMMRRYVRFT